MMTRRHLEKKAAQDFGIVLDDQLQRIELRRSGTAATREIDGIVASKGEGENFDGLLGLVMNVFR